MGTMFEGTWVQVFERENGKFSVRDNLDTTLESTLEWTLLEDAVAQARMIDAQWDKWAKEGGR